MDSGWACPHCNQMHAGQCAQAQMVPPELGGALPELQAAGAPGAVLPWAAAARVDYGLEAKDLRALIALALDAAHELELPAFERDEPLERSGFGDAPGNPLAAPAYALRVWKQKRALTGALSFQKGECERTRQEAGDALATLGTTLHARAGDPELADLAELFKRVEEADSAAADRSDVQALAEEQDAAELARLDAAVEKARAATALPRKKRDAAAKKEAKCRTELERAEAMLKRCDIELRALQNAAEADAARTQSVEAARVERQAEVDAARTEHGSARAALDQHEADLKITEAAVADAQGAREQALAAQQQRRAEYQAEVDAAHGEGRGALIALAARAFERQLVEVEAAKPAVAALQALQDAARERALIEAAVAAEDAGAVRNGMIVAGAGLAALLGTLLMLAL